MFWEAMHANAKPLLFRWTEHPCLGFFRDRLEAAQGSNIRLGELKALLSIGREAHGWITQGVLDDLLRRACANGRTVNARMLIARGANVNADDTMSLRVASNCRTIALLVRSGANMATGAQGCHKEDRDVKLCTLLCHGFDINTAVTSNGDSLLHLAAMEVAYAQSHRTENQKLWVRLSLGNFSRMVRHGASPEKRNAVGVTPRQIISSVPGRTAALRGRLRSNGLEI